MSKDFEIGDIIYKKGNNENGKYKILELREEHGGNWHDGHTKTVIATLIKDIIQIGNSEKEEYMLKYHCFGNEPIYFADKIE